MVAAPENATKIEWLRFAAAEAPALDQRKSAPISASQRHVGSLLFS
jgi:hypothetical protein